MRDLLLFGLTATHTRLFRCLDDLTDDEARRSPAGGLSPIIWQAGHLALSDFNAARRVDASSTVPTGYVELFNMGTGGEAAYPSLAEVKDALRRGEQAVEAVARNADLSKPVDSRSYSTVGEMLIFTYYHRGYHIGKITTLRALLKKPRLFG